jgi:hypothetical protein
MTSNHDSKKKELDIPMTGIEVMNDLSLDAIYMLNLAYKGLLVPFIPPHLNTKWIELCMSSRDDKQEHLSRWRYRKSDVEEFKLKHKDFLEELRKQKATPLAESQKQVPLESEYLIKIGKKGGEKSKINRPILDAVTQYMVEDIKTHDMTNGQIAKKFCKEYSENSSMLVTVDMTKWEIYCEGDLIFSRIYESHNKKANNNVKSIKFHTLLNNYIPKAKASISPLSDKLPI